MSTKIILIRHCESAGNTGGTFQGQTDCDISETGRKQLDLLALRCRNLHFDAIVSSPLLRAYRTAEAVNRYRGLEIQTDARLEEIGGGAYENTPWSELPARFPEETRRWYEDPGSVQAPGGESMRQVYDRVWAALLELVRRYPGGTVCVTSHGCAIRNMLCHALGYPLARIGEVPWCNNTSLTSLVFTEDGQVRVEFMNDYSHLTPETSNFSKQKWWSSPPAEPGGEVKEEGSGL